MDKSVTSTKEISTDLEHGSYCIVDPHSFKIIKVKDHLGCQLTITNVKGDDLGLYWHHVNNHVGEDYNSAFLNKDGKRLLKYRWYSKKRICNMHSYKAKTVKSVDHLSCMYNGEMLRSSSVIYICLSPSSYKVMANVRVTFKTLRSSSVIHTCLSLSSYKVMANVRVTFKTLRRQCCSAKQRMESERGVTPRDIDFWPISQIVFHIYF